MEMEISENSGTGSESENVTSCKKQKMSVKKSKFSEFFEIDIVSGGTLAICKLCVKSRKKRTEIKMKNRNTSGLKKHLISLHRSEYHKLFPSKASSSWSVSQFFKPIGSTEKVSSNVYLLL